MVLPEGASTSEPGRPGRWKLGAVVIAVAVTFGAALVLVGSTTPDPVPAAATIGPTSTTESLIAPTTLAPATTIDFANFSAASIATGERLSWFKAPAFVTGWPIALVSHDSRIWLFTATTTSGQYWTGRGLNAWVSSDGIGWEPAGEVVGEDFSVTNVEAVGDRLVAMGSRHSDGTPHVWVSRDGFDWAASSLPVELEIATSTYRTWLTGVAGSGERLYLAGFVEPNWQAEIIERLPPEVAEHVVREYGLGYSDLVDGERRIEVYGPMGLLAYSATLAELGVDADTASKLFDGSHATTSFIWSTEDGTNWSYLRYEDTWVQELTSVPDGTLFLNAGDFRGSGIWVSPDGSDWERLPSRTHMRVIGSWNDALVAVSNDRDLVVSNDADDWVSLGTNDLLPSRLFWQLHPVATGEAGLAMIASTWPETHSRQPTSVTVQRDGSTLEYDPTSGRLRVSKGDLTVSVSLWTGNTTDLLRVDFATEEVAFLEPESGEIVGTFTFADLRHAESTAFGPATGVHALLLTETGESWSIIDLSEGIGPLSRVLTMEYLDDRLVMVTTSSSPWSPQEQADFAVRVARVP